MNAQLLEKAAIALLKVEQENGDTENAHGNADRILCQLLTELGFVKTVEEYQKIAKWYA